jgi:hypothetical protein
MSETVQLCKDVIIQKPVTREQIMQLERAMKEIPEQVDLDENIRNYFAPGVYARELFVPKGVLLTGKIHKTEHLNILSQGKLLVSSAGKRMIVEAPFTYVSPVGTKRVIYAIEDSTWTTIHATEETDLDVIEEITIAETFTDLDNQLAQDDYVKFLSDMNVTENDVQEMTNRPHNQIAHSGLEVLSSGIHGKGIFTRKSIKKGTLIALMKDGGKKTLAGRYCNHSGNPNAEMVVVDEDTIELVALRDICDEEITTDYRNNIRSQL